MKKPSNDNQEALSPDEILFQYVSRVCLIANMAKTLSELHQLTLTENGVKISSQALADLHEMTRDMDTNVIMSLLTVNIASAAKSKHTLGATLVLSKDKKQINLRMHYGSGYDDFHDMVLSADVATQLRDGLSKALGMISANSLILPNGKLIQ